MLHLSHRQLNISLRQAANVTLSSNLVEKLFVKKAVRGKIFLKFPLKLLREIS
jgi:hypothetical protein